MATATQHVRIALDLRLSEPVTGGPLFWLGDDIAALVAELVAHVATAVVFEATPLDVNDFDWSEWNAAAATAAAGHGEASE